MKVGLTSDELKWRRVHARGGFPKCSAPRQVEVVGCIRGQRWKTLSKHFGPKSQLIFYWKDALNQTRVSAIWCKYNIQYVYLMYDKCWSFNHCLHYCMFLGLSVHLSFPFLWTPYFKHLEGISFMTQGCTDYIWGVKGKVSVTTQNTLDTRV